MRRALWLLAGLPLRPRLACGGGSTDPAPTATPDPTTPALPTASPTPTATPAPAWWEEETPEPTPDLPMSRVWNVRVEATSDAEVTLTFDYHLDLAPEANVFVHMGLLPNVNIGLLDSEGDTIEWVGGELDPTEFGDDTVGGQGDAPLRRRRGRAFLYPRRNRQLRRLRRTHRDLLRAHPRRESRGVGYPVSKCRSVRFRPGARLERRSISKPTTSFASL